MDSTTAINFRHVKHPALESLPNLTRLNSAPGQPSYYTDGIEKYISVTSFLAAKPKPQLEAWKARVGEKEAAKISKRATDKGKALHGMVESMLRNEPVVLSENVSEYEWTAFKGVVKRINNIYLVEQPIYSKKYELAGTPDTIAEYDGVLSVIDFKTSLRQKQESYIEDYFLQATAYSEMFTEITELPVKQIVIAISINNNWPQVFIRKTEDYIPQFCSRLKEFRRQTLMRGLYNEQK